MEGHISSVGSKNIENSKLISYKEFIVLLSWCKSRSFGQRSSPKVTSAHASLKRQRELQKWFPPFIRAWSLSANQYKLIASNLLDSGQSIFILLINTCICGCLKEGFCLSDQHHVEAAPPRQTGTCQEELIFPVERDVRVFFDFCMSNYGLRCQHDFLRILITDLPGARLDPANVHSRWFLDNAFVPVSSTSDAIINKIVIKWNYYPTRIPKAEERSKNDKFDAVLVVSTAIKIPPPLTNNCSKQSCTAPDIPGRWFLLFQRT